ncbi:hypothetical protein, partial [Serratia ficaria]|uniref:hypothetical protein n=1 Tax=Serratia ficaria TaxID=61651 RepID=UPI0021B7CAEE
MSSSHQGMQSISAAWRDALIDVNAYVAAEIPISVRVKVVVASVDSCGPCFPLRIQPHFFLPAP